jgi:hypothetical protein
MNFVDKIKNFKNIKPIEIIISVVFATFIIFPIPIPASIAHWINNPLGVAFLLILTIYLFFSFHPLVGLLFLFVTYFMVHRSSQKHNKIPILNHSKHSEKKHTVETTTENISLEEETVFQNGVYNDNQITKIEDLSYTPVYDNAHFAEYV